MRLTKNLDLYAPLSALDPKQADQLANLTNRHNEKEPSAWAWHSKSLSAGPCEVSKHGFGYWLMSRLWILHTCHCRSRTPPGRGGCTRTLRKRTSVRSFKLKPLGFQTITSVLTSPPLWSSGVREVIQASLVKRIRHEAYQRGTLW